MSVRDVDSNNDDIQDSHGDEIMNEQDGKHSEDISPEFVPNSPLHVGIDSGEKWLQVVMQSNVVQILDVEDTQHIHLPSRRFTYH